MADHAGIIIVTGSNGRIGDAVMRRLAGQFDHIVGFDRKAPNPPPPGCVHVPVDVTSAESIHEGLAVIREHHGSHVAAVVHLAAYYDFLGAPSPRYEQITVEGTRRLLRGLQELDFTVEQFIFSSTMLVHRPVTPGEFISETSPIEATWAYPASKVRTEQVIAEERGEIPAAVLRIAGVYDDECHSIPLAHQIQRIYERWMTARVYSGSTAHGQSFLHMDDLVDAIEAAIMRRATLPVDVAVVLGEPDPLSYDELQHSLIRLIHGEKWAETLEIPIVLAPFAKLGTWVLNRLPGRDIFLRPWMISRANDHYALDVSLAQSLLGWTPRRTLRGALPLMVEALKADPLAWYAANDLEPSSAMRRRTSSSAARDVSHVK
jgi:nucleoside-diphosphate-sugar epimerase